MNDEQRALKIIKLLSTLYTVHGTILIWKDEFELLVAVMLSAQTTDVNVNKCTPELFEKYPTPKKIAQAPLENLENIIYKTGFYKAKASRLKKLAHAIDEMGGVPHTMDDLIKLPGVGRKTANVVLQVWKNEAVGIVMDTHIQRVTMRLGFIEKKDPELGEQTMMRILPQKQWIAWGDLLIQHGRAVCTARKPDCQSCVLNELCPVAFSFS